MSTRGKPAPDLYLHAADALGVAIADCAIIEDSPVGATGAVASGGYVIGLCAGTHCAPDHADRLRAIGVDAIADDFAEVAAPARLAIRGRSPLRHPGDQVIGRSPAASRSRIRALIAGALAGTIDRHRAAPACRTARTASATRGW